MIRSFVAKGYRPRFDKRTRQAFGMAKGEQVGTFVLARRSWTEPWEAHAMTAIAGALKERGLSRLSALRWRSRWNGWTIVWRCHAEAEGSDAETRLRELIAEDEAEAFPCWKGTLFMWSSDSGASRVLASRGPSDTDDRGFPPGTARWSDDYLDAVQTVVFSVWGEKITETLDAIEAAARWAEGHFRETADPLES